MKPVVKAQIQNPILRGFNPDPSIIRVGGDYYIATSTFEWFPGVQIHHSRDLANWTLLTRPLDRPSQLDLRGVGDSAGVFAPCLSHDSETYYLVYTIVRSLGKRFMDTLNFLVTAKAIQGPWSEPIFLNSNGFDPSLFHARDGSKWLVNLCYDHRGPWDKAMAGIELRQYDHAKGKLVGESRIIYRGDGAEGAHLYQRNGYYYLLTAEGGTHYGHKACLSRSKSIQGPYQPHPDGPLVSSASEPDHPLQKAGHADLVEAPDGASYLCCLVARPLTRRGRCTLGRETAIQRVRWDSDHWLRTLDGSPLPPLRAESSLACAAPSVEKGFREDFDSPELNIHFQSLRTPLGEDQLSLTERPGYLRLKGAESPQSLFRHSLVGCRQTEPVIAASTLLDCNPLNSKQMAGLLYWYNSSNFYYLHLSYHEQKGRSLTILSMDNRNATLVSERRALPAEPIELAMLVDGTLLQFSYAVAGGRSQVFGPPLDASICSDDYGKDKGTGWFTGAFAALASHDLTGQGFVADFDWFEYNEG